MPQQRAQHSEKTRQVFQPWRLSHNVGIPSQSKRGELSLEYADQDGKTVLTYSRFSHPWYVFSPLYLDQMGSATTFLTNPSGGLVGGDNLSLVANLEAHTHVLFTTPSATKIYRTQQHPVIQTIDITVGPHAILEWVPELTIPYAGSRFEQTITVQLDTGACLILWDALAAGRIAQGERWGFSHFENRIKITLTDGKSLQEQYALAPIQDEYDGTLYKEWNYVGSLYIVSDKIPSPTWERIKDGLATVLEKTPNQILGGVSEPSVPGLAIKVVTRSAPNLNAVFEEMWGIVRMKLWGTTLPTLRRY